MLIHTLINAWSEFGVSTEDAEALVQNLIKALNDEEIALYNERNRENTLKSKDQEFL